MSISKEAIIQPFTMPSGPSIFFDVDDTLIKWTPVDVEIPDNEAVTIDCSGFEKKYKFNKYNVDMLINMAIRGHVVVVWSGSGPKWCEAVVKALKLESYVWAVMSKPSYYVDDRQDSSSWIGKWHFTDFDGNKLHNWDSVIK